MRRSSMDARRQQILAGAEPRDLMAAPEDGDRLVRLGAQREMLVGVGDQRGRPLLIFAGEPPLGGGEQHLAVGMARGRVDLEREALEPADRIGADADLALLVDRSPGTRRRPCAPRSRISTEVRRSTKRWVSRSCSASDSFSSTAIARSAIAAGSASQSARWAI